MGFFNSFKTISLIKTGLNLKNNDILKVGMVLALFFIILTSGCISFPKNEIKTFSDGVMSFNYPGDFYNLKYYMNNDSSSPLQAVGQLQNSDRRSMQLIRIGKNKSATSPTEVRDMGVSKLKNNSSCELLSTTTETNPNGIVVEKITYTQEDASFGTVRYNDMIFKVNGAVYGISAYGLDSNKQQITKTASIIFQSIK